MKSKIVILEPTENGNNKKITVIKEFYKNKYLVNIFQKYPQRVTPCEIKRLHSDIDRWLRMCSIYETHNLSEILDHRFLECYFEIYLNEKNSKGRKEVKYMKETMHELFRILNDVLNHEKVKNNEEVVFRYLI